MNQALRELVKPKKLDGGMPIIVAYVSRRCRPPRGGDSVPRPPKVLILMLKWLSDFTRDKMHKQVRYPGCLDAPLYMSEQKVGPLDYVLYAVLVHSGRSCHQGHYICCVRAGNGQWYKMDDAKVTPCAVASA